MRDERYVKILSFDFEGKACGPDEGKLFDNGLSLEVPKTSVHSRRVLLNQMIPHGYFDQGCGILSVKLGEHVLSVRIDCRNVQE